MNINRVVLTGNLTADPELRALPGGTSVCKLRVACNTRRKTSDGEWVDRPNFFDVTVFGTRGEAIAAHLGRGRGVAIDGRLEWREWDTEAGGKRQAVEIVADTVQFLPVGKAAAENGNGTEPAPAGVAAGGEDIPL